MTIRATVAALTVVVAGVLPVHLTGALAPRIQEDLGFGDATLGVLVALFFAVSSATTALGGRLADGLGPQPALRLAAVSSGVALVFIGTQSRTAAWLGAGLLLATVGNAISQPGANVLVARGVGRSRQGLAMGIKQSAIAVSTALSGLTAALLGAGGWERGYLLAVVVAVAAVLLVPDPGHVPERSAATDADEGWRAPGVIPAVLTGFAGAASVASIGTFMVRAAEEAGYSPTAAGAILTGGSVILIGARIGWGALADRGTITPLLMVPRLLAVGLLGYLALATGTQAGVLVGAAIAFGAGWSWPGLLLLGIMRRFPTRTGAVTGLAQAGMFSGAVLGPLLFGIVAESVGFAASWALSATFAALAAVAAHRTAATLVTERRTTVAAPPRG